MTGSQKKPARSSTARPLFEDYLHEWLPLSDYDFFALRESAKIINQPNLDFSTI